MPNIGPTELIIVLVIVLLIFGPKRLPGLGKQLGTVQRTILRLAFPGGKVRPKPGPYRGEKVRTSPGGMVVVDTWGALRYAASSRGASPAMPTGPSTCCTARPRT